MHGPREIAISARLRLIQTKFLHMSYKSPRQIHRAYPTYSPACPKCAEDQADFIHMVWTCPKLKCYWSRVGRELSRVLEHEIDLTPKIALLGILFAVGDTRAKRTFIGIATILAKRDIAKHWMGKNPPTIKEWSTAMDRSAKLEEPIYLSRGYTLKHKRKLGNRWDEHGLQR